MSSLYESIYSFRLILTLCVLPMVFYIATDDTTPVERVMVPPRVANGQSMRAVETGRATNTTIPGKSFEKAPNTPANLSKKTVEPEDEVRAEDIYMKSMDNCPLGWPLEIGPQTNEDTPYQVCRNINGTGDWTCAPGWEQLGHHPFCQIKRTSPECSAVSNERKLLFINIPHTGGMALTQSNLFSRKRQGNPDECQGRQYHGIKEFDAAAYGGYHKFAMVRHPCSRLISIWRSFVNRKNDTWTKLHLDKESLLSFTSFMEKVLYPGGDVHVDSEENLQSQVSMLFNESEQFGLDQLMYFERWNRSIDELQERGVVDFSFLRTHQQPVIADENCSAIYSSKTWSKLTEVYAMDFCFLGYSRNKSVGNTLPTKPVTSEVLNIRYQECKKRIFPSYLSYVDSHYKGEQTKKSCFIYTYFVLTPDSTPRQKLEKEQLLEFWKRSWASMGWIPRILSEENAKSHPAYEKYREIFWSFPRVHGRQYGYNNLMRHLAMSNIGGGWMSDSDVLPLRLPGCSIPFNNGSFTVYQGFVPALVSGNASEYFRVATLMATVNWKKHPEVFSINGRDHVSDMYCLMKFREDGAIRSVRMVEGARHIFKTPFNCNNTKIRDETQSSLKDNGIPPLPVAAHFSHEDFTIMKAKDPSILQEMWKHYKGAGNITQYESSRVLVMKVANDFFHLSCDAI